MSHAVEERAPGQPGDGQHGPGLRERKKQATRHRIKGEALRLALEGGLEHLTVEAIAEAADVSPRTFFNYFDCKEDALISDGGGAVAELHGLVLAQPDDLSPLAAVRSALESSELFTSAHLDRDRALDRQRLVRANPSLLPRQLAQYAAVERTFIEALAERIGVDPDDDLRPALVSAVAVTVIRVAMQRWTVDESRPLTDLMTEEFALLEVGL